MFYLCCSHSLASRQRQGKPAPLGMRKKGCPRKRLCSPNLHLSTREQGGHKEPNPVLPARPMPKNNHRRTPGPPAHHLHRPTPECMNSSAAGDPSPPTPLGGTASAGSSSHITQSIYDFFPFEIWAFTTHRKEEESASKPVNL